MMSHDCVAIMKIICCKFLTRCFPYIFVSSKNNICLPAWFKKPMKVSRILVKQIFWHFSSWCVCNKHTNTIKVNVWSELDNLYWLFDLVVPIPGFYRTTQLCCREVDCLDNKKWFFCKANLALSCKITNNVPLILHLSQLWPGSLPIQR